MDVVGGFWIMKMFNLISKILFFQYRTIIDVGYIYIFYISKIIDFNKKEEKKVGVGGGERKDRNILFIFFGLRFLKVRN